MYVSHIHRQDMFPTAFKLAGPTCKGGRGCAETEAVHREAGGRAAGNKGRSTQVGPGLVLTCMALKPWAHILPGLGSCICMTVCIARLEAKLLATKAAAQKRVQHSSRCHACFGALYDAQWFHADTLCVMLGLGTIMRAGSTRSAALMSMSCMLQRIV